LHLWEYQAFFPERNRQQILAFDGEDMKKPLSYYKQLAVEFWSFLRDHPEITIKSKAVDFPRYKEIRLQHASCPCCTVFRHCDCIGCPLATSDDFRCTCAGSPFFRWLEATTAAERQAAAAALIAQLEAWETED
jgi:hypothetical protein